MPALSEYAVVGVQRAHSSAKKGPASRVPSRAPSDRSDVSP